jgi:hypothetical protein
MYERGAHSSMSSVPKARGIDNRFLDYIDQQCRDNKTPKQILESLKCKILPLRPTRKISKSETSWKKSFF